MFTKHSILSRPGNLTRDTLTRHETTRNKRLWFLILGTRNTKVHKHEITR